MAEIYTKGDNCKWHYGKLGGYLQDENQCLYGITCRHVTQAASDEIIYIRNEDGTMMEFGKTLKRSKDYEIAQDIDLILINEEMYEFCEKSMRNSKGKICPAYIYDYPLDKLYSKRVFMRLQNTLGCDSSPQVAFFDITSAKNHSVLRQKLDTKVNFMIESSSDLKPGESGNVLSIEYTSHITIVGIILGGMLKLDDNVYGLCLRFDYGVKLLEKTFYKTLRLPDTFQITKSNLDNSDSSIQIGICIWVKVPEDVCKTDFVLFEHLIMLIECFADNISARAMRLENFFEEQLSRHVNSRNKSIHVITCASIDEKCFHECMIGCDYLYSGNFDKSDEHLKEAVRQISKTSCRNRLLCKLITYSTWQLHETDKLDYMKKLLEKGETYMLQMIEFNACPLKSIGYHYFDFSRYHYRLQNYRKAMEMAKKSLEYFEKDEKYRQKSSHGKCFALSMIARLNLMCGNKFQTRHMPVLDLEEAHQCLRDMKSFGKLPAVEKTSYLLFKADLHYRRGEIEQAKKNARKCYHLAAQNHLQQERFQAEIRIKELCATSLSNRK